MVWTMSVIAQIYLLIILVSDWKAFTIMSVMGILMAFITAFIVDEKIILDQFRFEYIPIIGFVLFSGLICTYKKDEDSRKKIKLVKSIAGSIAHEVRNPLNAINLIREQINELILKFKSHDKEENKDLKEKELIELTSEIANSIKRANDIINITLNDLKGEKLDSKSFTHLNSYEVVKKAVKEYGYNNINERNRVINNITKENNFIFSGDETLVIYIIFNLMKNALYYLSSYPDSTITIGTELKENYNIIYVYDTGPGIPQGIIKKLFGDFYTSGKKEGTGLGLAFCKRVMIDFGGDIICESEVVKGKNGWTKFSLLFPKLSFRGLSQSFVGFSETNKKKILIVDDDKVNLMIEKSILEKKLNCLCDFAANGLEALEMVKISLKDSKKKEYEFILMDLEMPVMNGYESIKEIKNLNNSLPIIAYSSVTNAQEKVLKAGANGYLFKHDKKELLTKTVAKWMAVKYDYFEDKSIDDIKNILENKKVLLADDEATNLLMLSKYIEKFGVIVDKAYDGDELINKFKEKNDLYDIIITDINMYKINGDQATIEIRNFERENNLKQIPIIAFTGDSDIKKIHHFLNIGMNDYFVKGDDNQYLIRTIAFWIKNHLNL